MPVQHAADRPFQRAILEGDPPYADFTGTTNASANTAQLFNHGLVDAAGKPIVPSKITFEYNGAGVPAGQIYDLPASRTTTQADVRATGASVPFTARAWA